MLNPFSEVNWNPGLPERREFGRRLIAGFLGIMVVLSVIARVTTHAWQSFPLWIGAVGASVGLLIWAVPRLGRPFYVVWHFVGACVAILVTTMLLTAFFYLILTPIGLVMRAFGRASLRTGVDRSCNTYWENTEKRVDLRRYFRQF